MKKLIYIVFLVSVVGLSCCTPDPQDTIVFIGSESYVRPMTKLVDSVSWLNAFLSGYDNIPEGYYPPDIQGEYKISEKQFVTSNIGYDLSDPEEMDMYLKVVNQFNRVASVEFYEGSTVWTDTAYIIGSGQRFSLYFVETRELLSYGTNHIHRRLVLITGKMTEEGIKDLYFGSLILDAEEGGDPLVGAFNPGWYFIYKDKDGLSEPCDWFSHHNEEGDENEDDGD
ncbi:MAG: hypothetical protein IKT08_02080 [Bacteroidales bacterium]|nr:hypothetical protein [Bacteroidales bacterium]